MPRFIAMPCEVMLDPELSPNAKVVYGILRNALFDGQDIVISYSRIAQHLGLGRSATVRSIAELEGRNLIERKPSGSRFNVNRFAFIRSDSGTSTSLNPAISCSADETTSGGVVPQTNRESSRLRNASRSADEPQPIRNSLNFSPRDNARVAAENHEDDGTSGLRTSLSELGLGKLQISEALGTPESISAAEAWATAGVSAVPSGTRNPVAFIVAAIRDGRMPPDRVAYESAADRYRRTVRGLPPKAREAPALPPSAPDRRPAWLEQAIERDDAAKRTRDPPGGTA